MKVYQLIGVYRDAITFWNVSGLLQDESTYYDVYFSINLYSIAVTTNTVISSPELLPSQFVRRPSVRLSVC